MTCDTFSTFEAGEPGATPKTSAPAFCSFGVYPRYESAAAFAWSWAWLISKKPCVSSWSGGVVGPSNSSAGTTWLSDDR